MPFEIWYNFQTVIYALRKLIAFVFLGGMFWFIYQDLDNLDKPWFMHALGVITVLFAAFLFFVPTLVVKYRIFRRRRQNAVRYAAWRASLAGGDPVSVPVNKSLLPMAEGERAFLHEKGTLYVPMDVAFDVEVRGGRASDVAFPGFDPNCGRIQRTHCYITDRRVVFAAKGCSWDITFADLHAFDVAPGGLVFDTVRCGKPVRAAFTFQNPLVVADILRFAMRSGA